MTARAAAARSRGDGISDTELIRAGFAKGENTSGTLAQIDRGLIAADRRDRAFHGVTPA